MLAGLRQRATGEGLSLMEASGTGVVYLAHQARNVTVLELNNETLQVESEQLLALNGNLTTNVTFAGGSVAA